MKKIAVVCGGYSEESVISAQSADTVIKALKEASFEVYKVWIDQSSWHVVDEDNNWPIDRNDFSATINDQRAEFDAVFNTIHGTPGEDGLLQGYFDMMGMPYNNCDVFVSALTFHKAACNRYLRSFGIQSAESVMLSVRDSYDTDKILEVVGLPCFVKPNSSGSSLGISKVKTKEELVPAINAAFAEDNEILIERFMDGTEVTCGAWAEHGKAKSIAITEIVSEQEFFDYQAKYHDIGTQEITPARIPDDQYQAVMRQTEEIYQILGCKGVIRVDYIIEKGEPLLIEVNTTPGLSSRSLIPQQVEYVGMKLSEFFGEQMRRLTE
jgi:D-alanine-D-alanine ligase